MAITYSIQSTDGTPLPTQLEPITEEWQAESLVTIAESAWPGHGWHVVPEGEAEPAPVEHIRRPAPRLTRREAAGRHRYKVLNELRADYAPDRQGTYCGDPVGPADWDRRTAVSAAHAAAAEAACCAECLRIARTESA